MRAAINLLDLSSYADRFRMLCALAAQLAELWLLTDALPDALRAEAAAAPGLRVVALGNDRFKRRAARWLDDRVRTGALDVVHDTFGHLAGFFQAHGADPKRRFRLVNTLYTTNRGWFDRVRPRGFDQGPSYLAQRVICLWRDARVCPMADRTLVLGPGHEADVMALGVPRERIEWLPSELDLTRFTPGDGPRSGAPLVLFTGTVWRNKGIDLLLDVLPLLQARWPGLQAHLVGNVVPWERDWLASAAAKSGLGAALHLPGKLPREALLDLYWRADVFVFPSLFEGSPRSVREAVACGCPAVVSDIPGCRGIDPDGAFLRFAPPGDRPAWLDALTEALEEAPEAAAARRACGLAHLRQHHTPAAVAARLADLYQRLRAAPPWPATR
ncbi:MAG: glycosyltransferase family 4 protein [Myxococcales bacterium]|nr:glycosyltransferase family 4 protein [Myxococcales bacterium]